MKTLAVVLRGYVWLKWGSSGINITFSIKEQGSTASLIALLAMITQIVSTTSALGEFKQ